MDATVIDFADNVVELKIKEEDISIMYVLQYELLQNKKIEFAGVALKHLLTKDYEFRIVTESGNPLDALLQSTKTAVEHIEDMLQVFNKAK